MEEAVLSARNEEGEDEEERCLWSESAAVRETRVVRSRAL